MAGKLPDRPPPRTITMPDGTTAIEIPLTQGKVALVDPEDEPLASHRWHAQRSSRNWYASRAPHVASGERKNVWLHRAVLGITDPKIHVDHRNGDGLDCRRSNIRVATPAQNGANRRMQKNNSSGFRGVRLCDGGRWRAEIRIHGRKQSLGHYGTAEAAACAYDEAARAHFGEFARPNFAEVAT